MTNVLTLPRRLAGALIAIVCALMPMLSLAPGMAHALEVSETVEGIAGEMSLDEKVSQLIVVSCRSWDGVEATDLAAAPGLAEALARHQYGGVILFAANIESNAQVIGLVDALQENNASIGATTSVGYLTCTDEEGGGVVRLTQGTRMTGSMAIGATGAAAEQNAYATGKVLGEEMAALGLNCDFAPSLDVNSNPANPVIGVRSFSDDPNVVAALGTSFARGVCDAGVIACDKHFPGHGDTDTDSHLGLPMIDADLATLEAREFVPFRAAVEAGADLIMTAHVALPQVAEHVTLADGSEVTLPATMSHAVLTGVLREGMGYDGVVITDALEMDAIGSTGLVEGEEGSATYGANVAVTCLKAGVDLLLMPRDLTDEDAAAYLDDYVALVCEAAEQDPDLMARIEESVRRVLALKEAHGVLFYGQDRSFDERVEAAEAIVGSEAHHATESDIAHQAVTLIKNEGGVLPVDGQGARVVIASRYASDVPALVAAVRSLAESGAIAPDTYVESLPDGMSWGSPESVTHVAIGCYLDDSDTNNIVWNVSEELADRVHEADLVCALSVMWGSANLDATGAQYQGISGLKYLARDAGASFALLSCNLPYDAARYTDADAILACYLSAGMDVDPTTRSTGDGTILAFNPNVRAAIDVVFGAAEPHGTLSVALPHVLEAEDGSVSFSDEILFERGFGLTAAGDVVQASAASAEAPGAEQADTSQETEAQDAGPSFPLPIVALVAAALGAALVVVIVRRRA